MGSRWSRTVATIPHVGGRRLTSFEPGGAKVEPKRYWLLLLLIGVAALIVIVMLDSTL